MCSAQCVVQTNIQKKSHVSEVRLVAINDYGSEDGVIRSMLPDIISVLLHTQGNADSYMIVPKNKTQK